MKNQKAKLVELTLTPESKTQVRRKKFERKSNQSHKQVSEKSEDKLHVNEQIIKRIKEQKSVESSQKFLTPSKAEDLTKPSTEAVPKQSATHTNSSGGNVEVPFEVEKQEPRVSSFTLEQPRLLKDQERSLNDTAPSTQELFGPA